MEENFKKKSFCLNFIVFFGFATGIMVCPDTLTRLGFFIGKTGMSGLVLIALVTILYLKLLPKIYEQIFRLSEFQNNFIRFFYYCIHYILVFFLATGLLVTSGFVFNEVFLYWFPNFGFAFLLLGILVCLQFLSRKIIIIAQICFVSIPIIGLLILIISGITIDHPQSIDFSTHNLLPITLSQIGTLFLPLTFFIGIDFGFNILRTYENNRNTQNKIIMSTILCMGIIFILWGLVSLYFIPMKKLLQTTIPHMIAAKNILGIPGRFLMGSMLISGAMAAVHAIFSNICIHQLEVSATAKITKPNTSGKLKILFSGLIIGGLMAGGVAGDQNLDVFTKSALVLWLSSYSLVFFADLFIKTTPENHKKFTEKIKNIIIGLLLFISVLILIGSDKDIILMLKFIGTSILSILVLWLISIYRNHQP